MSRLFSFDLDGLREINLPVAIQVARKGVARPPNIREAFSMALSALGTLARSSGVRTLNVEIDGQPAALAIIADAQFSEDQAGNTTLEKTQR